MLTPHICLVEVVIASRTSLILSDLILIVVTWFKLSSRGTDPLIVGSGRRDTFAKVLLRHGTCTGILSACSLDTDTCGAQAQYTLCKTTLELPVWHRTHRPHHSAALYSS